MTDFKIQVSVDTRRAKAQVRGMGKELDKVEAKASRTGVAMKRAFGAAVLVAGITAATRTLATFSQEMSTVQAVTQATEKDFAKLRDTALDLGTNTRFTATQAAEGMTFLARAGFEADEVLISIGDTLNLAQAGALGLGRAADIASNVLKGMRLEVAETARVVDVLALAANSSNTTVEQLGEAMKLVAPIAAGVNVSLEETTAAISTLSDAGLQASLAGTGLRRVLATLETGGPKLAKALRGTGVTVEDVKVSSVGLTTALDNMAKAGLDTGTALQVFGQRGGPAFEVLRAAGGDVAEFTTRLEGADGTAQRIADTMDDNLNGSILAMKSAFEGLILQVGEAGATGALRSFVDVMTVGFRAVAENAELLTTTVSVLAVATLPLLFQSTILATAAFVKLKLAVLAGNVVVLGSAAATKLQAAAEVEAATAAALLTGAMLAQVEAALLKASTTAVNIQETAVLAALETRAAAATTANTAAVTTLTAAQARLATATAATSLQTKLLAGLTPFAIIIATGAVAAFTVSKVLGELEKVEEAALAVTEAGTKGGLTEFGKVGNDIIRIQENLARVINQIDKDVTSKGVANPNAIALAFRYKRELEALGVAQDKLKDGTASTAAIAREQVTALGNQATAVEDLVAAIEAENGLLALNNREREVQIALLQEVNALEDGGPDLTAEQKAQLKSALENNQALAERADVLDRIRGPQQRFEADLNALQGLLDSGTIKQSEFNTELKDMLGSIEGADIEGLDLESLFTGLDTSEIENLRDMLAEIRGGATGGDGVGPPAIDQSAGIPQDLTPDSAPLSDELQLQADLLAQIDGPQQQFLATQAALNQLLSDGAISAEEYAISLNDAAIASNTLSTDAGQGLTAGLAQIKNQIMDVSGTVQGALVNSFNEAQGALVDFVRTGEADFSGFVNSILDGLAEILIQQLLLAALPGGSAVGGFFSNLFGGARAEGGDVNPNQAFLVGEEGPELFTPPNAGNITPAGETAAMMQQQGAAPVVNVAPPQVNIRNEVEGEDAGDRENEILNVIRRKNRTVKGLIQ